MVVVVLLAAFLMTGSAVSAQPRDPDLPPVDPPGRWRQMTLDDATSDSKCVGKFDTALCAVETVIACFMRARNELCTRALLDETSDQFVRSSIGNRSRDLYRVVGANRLTEDSILDIPRRTEGVGPGDVRIDVQWRICRLLPSGEYCAPPLYDPNIFSVRQTDLGWRIVDWGTPDIRWPGRKHP